VTWTVNEGDCLDPVTGLASLADASVAHLISDPPYSERVHAGFGAERRTDLSGARGDIGFEHLSLDVLAGIAEQAARIVTRWAIVFTDDRGIEPWSVAFERAGMRPFCAGQWIKTDAMPRMAGDGPAYGAEQIVIVHARGHGRSRWHGGGKSAIWTGPVKEAGTVREHPTQKPLWLLEALVRDFTDPGELILDPFAGSGTTGVAARRLGRSFIGWERDPKYAATARRRIDAAREQAELFPARGPKPKQEALL